MSDIVKVAIALHFAVGVGVAATSWKCVWPVRCAFVLMWPIFFGCWLGERCNDAMSEKKAG
jgi:hypothetical protein